MRTRQPTTTLEDQRIPVRAKLAAAWTSFMFLYVYVDIIGFYKPGVVDAEPGATAPEEGTCLPLGGSFCSRGLDGRFPRLIPSTRDVPEAVLVGTTVTRWFNKSSAGSAEACQVACAS